MPFLFAVVAILVPRAFIAVLWFFSDWFSGVFPQIFWPILGFLFAPLTMLWYSVVVNVYQGQWDTLQIVVLVLAVLIDLSPAKKRRKKRD
jgi:hypothetical protein